VSYFVFNVFNNPNLFHLFLSCYDAHVVSIDTVSKDFVSCFSFVL
jgi:hypothetical protein